MKRLRCHTFIRALALLTAVCALWCPFSRALGETRMLDIPMYFQADYPDALFLWEDEEKSVASSGCGAVCAAMVLEYLLPEGAPTPSELFLWTYEQGLYRGNGLGYKAIARMLGEYGVTMRDRSPSAWILRAALHEGDAVILSVGAGFFTNSGHYVVARGLTDEGHLYIVDPNSKEKSEKAYTLTTVLAQTKALLVCSAPE